MYLNASDADEPLSYSFAVLPSLPNATAVLSSMLNVQVLRMVPPRALDSAPVTWPSSCAGSTSWNSCTCTAATSFHVPASESASPQVQDP